MTSQQHDRIMAEASALAGNLINEHLGASLENVARSIKS
jgi:hypothetical protein